MQITIMNRASIFSKFTAVFMVLVFAAPVLTFAAASAGSENAATSAGSEQSATTRPDIRPGSEKGPGQQGARTLKGKVTSVGASSFVFEAKSTSYTVDVSNARIYRRFGAAMKLSEIQVGDHVEVSGTVNGTSITAKLVRDHSLQARNGNFAGTVKSIATGSFVLQSKGRGDQTVNVSNATVFTKNNEPASFSDLKVGADVDVKGVWNNTSNNIAAEKVKIKVRIISVKLSGVLAAKTDQSFTVTGDPKISKDKSSNVTGDVLKTYKVDISKAALVKKNGGKASVSDFNVGDKLLIHGRHTAGAVTEITALMVKNQSSAKMSDDEDKQNKDKDDKNKRNKDDDKDKREKFEKKIEKKIEKRSDRNEDQNRAKLRNKIQDRARQPAGNIRSGQ